MGALAVGHDGGQKLYILGVAGYNKPIWDVLALQGEGEEAGERLYGAKFVELSKLGKRFCDWARCSRFFKDKFLYYSRNNVFTCNVPFFMLLGTR